MAITTGRGQPKYPLNIASQLLGLSPRTLRTHEEAGLIAPARIGRGSQRLYSEQDLQWLRCIRDMIHDEGLTVVGIRRLLDLIPCWEVRHCDAVTALQCAAFQNVPNMARQAASGQEAALAGLQRPDPPAERGPSVEVKLIYGVEELGAVLPCMRCISAERAARKVALRYPGRVRVVKHDVLSEEAAQYGPILVPTVVVGEEIVSAGKGLSEAKLEVVVGKHLDALASGR